MMNVARNEAEPNEIDEKYHELVDEIITENDYGVTDVIDNLETIYQLIKEKDKKENELIGKYVQIYPNDTNDKYGIIKDWNNNGMLIHITHCEKEPRDKTYEFEVGNEYYFSHSKSLVLKILN